MEHTLEHKIAGFAAIFPEKQPRFQGSDFKPPILKLTYLLFYFFYLLFVKKISGGSRNESAWNIGTLSEVPRNCRQIPKFYVPSLDGTLTPKFGTLDTPKIAPNFGKMGDFPLRVLTECEKI